jgi:hypothetical protein
VCTTGSVCGAGMCGTNNTDPCDDGDPCTVTDVCAAGACTAGTNVCFDCTAGGNLLTNCDLSSGITGWVDGPNNLFFDGAAGTQSVQNGMLVMNITNAGPNNYDVQPRQVGVVLVKDTTYVVKFNAMASVARGLTTSITQDGGGYQSYSGGQNFNLTTQMQLFSFEFTMTADPPAEKVKFEFDLGAGPNNTTVPNTVYLDNLSIAPKP